MRAGSSTTAAHAAGGGIVGAAEYLGTAAAPQPTSHVKAVPLSSSHGGGGSGHVLVTAGGCVITATYVANLLSSSNSRGNGPHSSGGVKGASHIAELLSDPSLTTALRRLTNDGLSPSPSSLPGLAAQGAGHSNNNSLDGLTLQALLDGHIDSAVWENALLGIGGGNGVAPQGASLSLSTGLVASLDVVPLPTGNTALGVVGTTHGTICAFIVRQQQGLTLVKLCETELSALVASSASARVSTAGNYSAAAVAAMISCEDTIQDVAISMDPAGRPEMVACATATCVAVVDALDLQAAATTAGDQDDEGGARRGHRRVDMGNGLPAIQRERSDPLCVVFSSSEVVRVLVPQHLHAAFAVDVAAVVVLSDGTLHYIERIVRGGSVSLLMHYHHQRQRQRQQQEEEEQLHGSGSGGGGLSSFEKESRNGFGMSRMSTAAGAVGGGEKGSLSLLVDPRAIPHVIYGYRLSCRTVRVARLTEGDATFHDLTVTVNDAALFYNAKVGRMDVALVGTKQLFLSTSQGQRRASAGPTGPSPAPMATHTTQQQQAWWAIARGVVLPQATLQPLGKREAALYDIGAGLSPSLHTVHAQSGSGLLYRAGVSGGGGTVVAGALGGIVVGSPPASTATAATSTVAAGSPLHAMSGSPVLGGGAGGGVMGSNTTVAASSLAAVAVVQKQNDIIGLLLAGKSIFALSLMAGLDHAGGGGTAQAAPSNAMEMMGGSVLATPRHILEAEVTVEAVTGLSECRAGSASAALLCVATGSALSVLSL